MYDRQGIQQADRPFDPGDSLSPGTFPASMTVCFRSSAEWLAFFSALYFTDNEPTEEQIQAIEEASQRWTDYCTDCATCDTLEMLLSLSEGTVTGFLEAFIAAAGYCCPNSPLNWQEEVEALLWPPTGEGGDIMIGDILLSAATSRVGCLLCDGAEYQRIAYPDLYATLDAVYKLDADRFVVPDLRGRTAVGAGSGAGLSIRSIGDEGGEELHTLTIAEMAAHQHTPKELDYFLEYRLSGGSYQLGFNSGVYQYFSRTETSSVGENSPHNTMQPFHVLNVFIVATV